MVFDRLLSGLRFLRYGALASLLCDKRQVFLFAKYISVGKMNATCLTRSWTICFHMRDVKLKTFSSFCCAIHGK